MTEEGRVKSPPDHMSYDAPVTSEVAGARGAIHLWQRDGRETDSERIGVGGGSREAGPGFALAFYV